MYQGLIHKYRSVLPIATDITPITLHEGNTPLIPLVNLAKVVGKKLQLFAKFEGVNPTGSFKDRGMTMAVTMAKAQGLQALVCASTGNTSASAAAYAARANMAAFVLIPDGKIAFGKLSQAIIHGAKVLQIAGNFDAGMQLVKALCEHQPIALVNSVNPYRLQGQKTIAYEIYEALGRVPDYHLLPVGNAANISAHWMGYCELSGETRDYPKSIAPIYQQHPLSIEPTTKKRPIMLGYQAQGSAPLVHGKPVSKPETLATAIRIGNPQSTQYAQESVQQSGGWFRACSDQQILQAQKLLADHEGIFCEPASAISLAGLLEDIKDGKIAHNSTLVLTLTGNGIKDPDTVVKHHIAEHNLIKVAATSNAIEQAVAESMPQHQ